MPCYFPLQYFDTCCSPYTPFFFWLNNIPSCCYSTFFQWWYSVMGNELFPTFHYYEKCCYEYCVFVWIFVFNSLDIYIEVEWGGGHMVILLTFWGSTKLFSMVPILFSAPTSNIWGLKFHHILASTSFLFFFLIITLTILVDVKWHLVILICMSLLPSSVEHLVMGLLAIYIFS